MSTKIFCDIADINQIKKFCKKKIVKGFTTNPSLMRKAGAKDYEFYSKKILKACKNKPISFEVFADDHKSMLEQGIKINNWGKNIFVKVPVVNSKNQFTGRVIKKLNDQNIKLNITAVYTAKQTAKSLIDGIMGVFGKKTTKPENKVEPAAASPVTNEDIQRENELDLSNISLDLGVGDKSSLITPIDMKKDLVASNISSLEEPAPSILTLPMGENAMAGSNASGSPSTPSNEIPPITSTDGSNPYLSFSESIYGVIG